MPGRSSLCTTECVGGDEEEFDDEADTSHKQPVVVMAVPRMVNLWRLPTKDVVWICCFFLESHLPRAIVPVVLMSCEKWPEISPSPLYEYAVTVQCTTFM